MASLTLSPPWVEFYRKIDAFFKKDPEVRVLYDEEDTYKEIKLYVDNTAKASALEELLPSEKSFGNVCVSIAVIPSNTSKKYLGNSILSTVQIAFQDNPIVSRIETVSGIFGYDLEYVLFDNCVVQYFTDNLGDYNGMHSTLYENIARDIFEDYNGVFFCTEKNSYATTDVTGIFNSYASLGSSK